MELRVVSEAEMDLGRRGPGHGGVQQHSDRERVNRFHGPIMTEGCSGRIEKR
jgi:hypothetical protein